MQLSTFDEQVDARLLGNYNFREDLRRKHQVMATGVPKRAKGADRAIVADMFAEEPFPLPSDDAVAEFVYPNKVAIEELLAPCDHEFYRLGRKTAVHQKEDGIAPNALILADNYFAMKQLIQQGSKVDLVYMDPPFATGQDFESRQQRHAYDDRFGEAKYIEFMRRRLVLVRELMSDDASIYLHIGHQMVSHLKVVMDHIFGRSRFKNLIVRRKCSSKNYTRKQLPNLNDYILFYTKGSTYKWSPPGTLPSDEWLQKEYPKSDRKGRYKLVPIHAPGERNGETGKPWRGMMPPTGKHWQFTPAKLEELQRAGEIHWSKNQNPRRKVYLAEDKMNVLTDYWDGFRDAHHQSIAVTGYPTEKNLALLKVIVKASSEPRDVVLDPFGGSGTTAHASTDLERRWLLIDESLVAAESTVRRLRHGMEAMGDYVRHESPKVVDLFGGSDEKGAKRVLSKPRAANFSIYVDANVYNAHPKQLDLLDEI